MADVFISYKRNERPEVERLAAKLRELGLKVWFDASMSAGDTFNSEIDREARGAKAILVCWSPAARESEWVNSEAMIGFTQKKLAACYVAGPDGFDPPAPFNTSHAEDLRGWLNAPSDLHSGWKSVLRRIGKLCGRMDIERFGALDIQATASELRLWMDEHEDSALFMTVDELLRARDAEEAQRVRIEQQARERRAREETERRAREAMERKVRAEAERRAIAEREERERREAAERRAQTEAERARYARAYTRKGNLPSTVLALIMLIAAVFMPFVSAMGIFNPTAIGLPNITQMAKPGLQMAANVSDAEMQYSPEMAMAQRAARDKANGQLMMMNLVYLVWLIPAGAAWLMFTNLTNKRNQLHELIVGGLGVAAVALFFVGKSMAISDATSAAGGNAQMAQMAQQAAAMADQALQLGLGGWLIGLAGAGLVATGLGMVKQTPGVPAG
ncbi:MAG: toll/interleukin-1 receptor domain-containing protein [Terricaulis sp.]